MRLQNTKHRVQSPNRAQEQKHRHLKRGVCVLGSLCFVFCLDFVHVCALCSAWPLRSSASKVVLPRQRGFILALVAVFGAIFLTVGTALASFLLVMQHAEQARIENEQSLAIAEAGANYYAWHLAHFPLDLQDGTGGSGPYVHAYADPEGGTAGSFSLSIDGNLKCGQATSIDITSTGSTANNPARTRTVFARYARESVAAYSYIVNAAVWAGASRTISGKYHSNNGVRMDGNNLSVVESSVASWSCDDNFGCSPTQSKPGVFGSGSNPAYFSYPVSQVDFAGITVNLSTLKAAAQTGGGIFFDTASGSASSRGYHLIFRNNGTVDVYRVSATTPIRTYSDAVGDFYTERTIIKTQTYLGNYAIPSACSVIFVNDRVWVEGVVKGKVTVAAADLSGSGLTPDAILPSNITYAAYDGTNGLTVVAAGNVLLPLNSPDVMEIHGVFIAQNGYYGRNYYFYDFWDSDSVPSAYQSYVIQSSLTTVGSVVSNGRTGTSWSCGGVTCSGYITRVDSYDGTLATDPPPFTPYTSSQYNFVQWRQQ